VFITRLMLLGVSVTVSSVCSNCYLMMFSASWKALLTVYRRWKEVACCVDKSRLATTVTAENTGLCVGELLCEF